jgi:hypothetical protein
MTMIAPDEIVDDPGEDQDENADQYQDDTGQQPTDVGETDVYRSLTPMRQPSFDARINNKGHVLGVPFHDAGLQQGLITSSRVARVQVVVGTGGLPIAAPASAKFFTR